MIAKEIQSEGPYKMLDLILKRLFMKTQMRV
jgi:hypothetical protein